MASWKHPKSIWELASGDGLADSKKRKTIGIDRRINPDTPELEQRVLERYTQWLPPSYAAHLSLQRIKQWQAIYRFLYNYSAMQSPPKVGGDEIDLSRVDSIAESINRSVNATVHL
ncbi:hypothetical protein HC02_21545 [Vibrio parahaemolyticus]|nr:hypothetical protein HC02_21545 [Vibrio parahaemolyticus]